MKKLFVLLLVLSMSFSFVACAAKTGSDNGEPGQTHIESAKDNDDEAKESDTLQTPTFIPGDSYYVGYDENNYYFFADSTVNGESKYYQYNLTTKQMRKLELAHYEPYYITDYNKWYGICDNFMITHDENACPCLVDIYTGETIFTLESNLSAVWYNDAILVSELRDGVQYLGVMNNTGEYLVPLHTNELFSNGFDLLNDLILCYGDQNGSVISGIYDPISENYIDINMPITAIDVNFEHDKVLLTENGLLDVTTNTTTNIKFGKGVDNRPYYQYNDYFILPTDCMDNGDGTSSYTYSAYDYSGNLISEYTTLPISGDSTSFTVLKDYYFYDEINPEDNNTYYYLRNADGSLATDPIPKTEWEKEEFIEKNIIYDDVLISCVCNDVGYEYEYDTLKICNLSTGKRYYFDYLFLNYDEETNALFVYATHPTYGNGCYIVDAHNPEVLINPFE